MIKLQKALATVVLLTPLLVNTRIASAFTQPASPAPGSTVVQRLEQRKKERAITLDEATQKRLGNQCLSTQSKIRISQQTLTQLFADRAKTNRQVDGKLWVSIGQLKLAEKDTFDLEQKRAKLAEKSATVENTASNFQQTLDDIVVLNCKADVVGFKALLDTSRLYLSQVRDQSADTRNYILNDIKPALATHAKELQPNAPTKGDK